MIYTTKCAGRDSLYERMFKRKEQLEEQSKTKVNKLINKTQSNITLVNGGFNIVSEDVRFVSTSSSFTTSELQSLIQMQSKVITALETEILELKETACIISSSTHSRVQELCKKIYNEITSKNKRLSKLVKLQTKLKRAK